MTHIASKSDVVNQRKDTENRPVFYLPLLTINFNLFEKCVFLSNSKIHFSCQFLKNLQYSKCLEIYQIVILQSQR